MELAHCDIETGKIYGCKENTFTYYHEEGHITFANSQKGSTTHLVQKYSFHYWMLSLTFLVIAMAYSHFNILKYLLPFPSLFLFIYFGIDFFEELWCNRYAKNKLKEVKNGKI
jgi:hypothetical protein